LMTWLARAGSSSIATTDTRCVHVCLSVCLFLCVSVCLCVSVSVCVSVFIYIQLLLLCVVGWLELVISHQAWTLELVSITLSSVSRHALVQSAGRHALVWSCHHQHLSTRTGYV
jgi:hypothetical protein